MKIVAIMCVRNELVYLREVIPYLKHEEIDVILIDNESSDGTLEELSASGSEYSNLVRVERLPFEGAYDQTAQLAIKSRMVEIADADWVIHHDADEILQSESKWGGLRDNIELAEIGGFNAVNFYELVMLPVDLDVDDFMHNNRNYYFHDPYPMQLMRAWKKSSGLTNVQSGGHHLSGDVSVYPVRMLLKHFIVRSQKHAVDKYVGRMFSPGDMRKGWHCDRVALTPDKLRIPTVSPWLHTLNDPKETPAKLPRATRLHYWQWLDEDNAV